MSITIKTLQEIDEKTQLDIDYLYSYAGIKLKNYRPDMMQDPTLATTVVYDGDELVSASSIIKREGYNIPRIMHRYFYADDKKGLVPKNFNGKIRTVIIDMMDQQVDLVKKLGYSGAFTSRETFKGFERTFTGIKEGSKHEWHTDLENRYFIIGTSWQFIMWTGDKYEHSNGKGSRPADAEELLQWKDRPINTKGYKR